MIKYIGFWKYSDNNPNNTDIDCYESYIQFYKKYVNLNKNILVIGPCIKKYHYKIIEDKKYQLKILHLGEPINNVKWNKLCVDIFKNKDKRNIITFGCINHDINKKQFKFPLFFLMFNNIKYIEDQDIYQQVNEYVKNCEIDNKKFCCLINSHDPSGHRKKIYQTLNNIKQITCPGKLLNNVSNKEVNKLGKPEYIKKFLFNICSENFDNNNISGYNTEKIWDCCMGGAIPIYAGWFDEIDETIFNKKRIIFYNSRDIGSYQKVYDIVNELMNNKEKIIEFYQQPVFNETAYKTIQMLKNDFINNIK
jgi:hypothetical protein